MMLRTLLILIVFLSLNACKTRDQATSSQTDDLVVAFGSCNKQYETNVLWDDVLRNDPKVWIWGGDVVYSDTDDMSLLKASYDLQSDQKA